MGLLRTEPAVDFASAQACGLEGVADDQVLHIAASASRILVTHDLKAMPSHLALLAESRSPGVILISQGTSVAEAIESLLLVWTASEAPEWNDSIVRLPF